MRILSTLLFVAMSIYLSAAPALRIRKKVTLNNGTSIFVTFSGDERASYWISDDGFIVKTSADGASFEKTSLRPEVKTEPHGLPMPMRVGSQATAYLSSLGTSHIPVVLVNFSDVKFSNPPTGEDLLTFYNHYFNGDGSGVNYTQHGSTGAVREYFEQQSNGAFVPVFHLLEPVTLSKPMSYYGKNNGTILDVNRTEFFQETFNLVTAAHSEAWKQYDNNGDGVVDCALIFFAGFSENVTNIPEYLWSVTSNTTYTANGVKIATTTCSGELLPRFSQQGEIVDSKVAGIGVLCHELSHALGLPDFYDVQGKNYGMDIWSLMDYGCYCKNGYAPVAYTAYEREFMGWRPMETLTSPCTVHVPVVECGGKGYKVVNPLNVNEYYVLENRGHKGWDAAFTQAMGAHGLTITHVNYTAGAWISNTVNVDATRQGMTPFPANNRQMSSVQAATAGMQMYKEVTAGNPFPGTSGNTAFTDTSVPAATLYTGGYMGKPILDITEQGDVVSFKFNPLGTLQAPQVKDVALPPLSDYNFTAAWSEVPQADTYLLEVFKQTEQGKYELYCSLDSLSDTQKEIVGVDPGCTYAYRVLAQADAYRNSAFSEYRTVTFPTVGINRVSLTPKGDDWVDVFNRQGIFLKRVHQSVLYKVLNKGLYIVRYANGNAETICL